MNARRSGIIIRMPSRPPSTDTIMTRTTSISKPSSIRAGMVTPTPKAIDSPAEPVVCTMLFSRIVARRNAEDAGQAAEQRDRQHGHRDRRRHGHADLEHQVERRGAEDDAQDRADEDGRPGELRHRRAGGDVGLVGRAVADVRGDSIGDGDDVSGKAGVSEVRFRKARRIGHRGGSRKDRGG